MNVFTSMKAAAVVAAAAAKEIRITGTNYIDGHPFHSMIVIGRACGDILGSCSLFPWPEICEVTCGTHLLARNFYGDQSENNAVRLFFEQRDPIPLFLLNSDIIIKSNRNIDVSLSCMVWNAPNEYKDYLSQEIKCHHNITSLRMPPVGDTLPISVRGYPISCASTKEQVDRGLLKSFLLVTSTGSLYRCVV